MRRIAKFNMGRSEIMAILDEKHRDSHLIKLFYTIRASLHPFNWRTTGVPYIRENIHEIEKELSNSTIEELDYLRRSFPRRFSEIFEDVLITIFQHIERKSTSEITSRWIEQLESKNPSTRLLDAIHSIRHFDPQLRSIFKDWASELGFGDKTPSMLYRESQERLWELKKLEADYQKEKSKIQNQIKSLNREIASLEKSRLRNILLLNMKYTTPEAKLLTIIKEPYAIGFFPKEWAAVDEGTLSQMKLEDQKKLYARLEGPKPKAWIRTKNILKTMIEGQSPPCRSE